MCIFARIGDESARFEQTVTRANAYLAAGADCAFIPGTADAEVIGKLVKAIDGPINVMAVTGMPSVPELEKLGVARVSTGGGPARAALTATSAGCRRVAAARHLVEFYLVGNHQPRGDEPVDREEIMKTPVAQSISRTNQSRSK